MSNRIEAKCARKDRKKNICNVALEIDDEKKNQGHLTHESVIAVKGGEVLMISAGKSIQSVDSCESNGRHCLLASFAIERFVAPFPFVFPTQ